MKKFLLFLLLSCIMNNADSQYVATYKDIMDLVYVFDDGTSRLLEPLPLKNYKVGKRAMLYSSPQGRLRAYYKGEQFALMDITPDYFVTDNWVGFYNFGSLNILYEDKFRQLDGLALPTYWVSDSLVVWESNLNDTRVFCDGKDYIIEQWAVPAENAKIADNIFAYVDRAGNFKAFYHGEVIMLEGFTPESFRVDRDIIMYKDYIGNFKVYSKGVFYETNIPYRESYQTGEGFFVFYDQQNRLNIWYDGEISILSQSRPKELLVKENIVAFTDQGNNFYAWYKGKMEMLERFQPLSMKADNDLLVYQEQYGRLMGYYYGKYVPVSSNIVRGDNYSVYNEVVVYSLVRGETSIWCKGKTYTYR